MTAFIPALDVLDPARFETPAILKRLTTASRYLAELKGVAASIPNEAILVNTLGMQEAKDSSAIENIVTTHDELFRDAAFPDEMGAPAAKEVLRYRQALRIGYDLEYPKLYSQDLINNLFSHPDTKIQFVEHDLGVSRLTATKYLDALAAGGVLRKMKIGRANFYINVALYEILAGEPAPAARDA